MKTAKVKTLAIQGSRKKPYKAGDIVNENQFTAERWAELVKGGYIVEGEETAEPSAPLDSKETIVTDNAPETKENAGSDLDTSKDETVKDESGKVSDADQTVGTEGGAGGSDTSDFDETTRKEIMVELDKMGVEYGKNMTKAELYDLFRNEKEKVK